MNKKLAQIFNNFGEETQLDKLREECTEFLYAHDRYKKYGHKNKRYKKLVYKEIEDISVVSAQLNNSIEEIHQGSIKKIERTLGRIEAGYYSERNGGAA